jgi:hypothetical protein
MPLARFHLRRVQRYLVPSAALADCRAIGTLPPMRVPYLVTYARALPGHIGSIGRLPRHWHASAYAIGRK